MFDAVNLAEQIELACLLEATARKPGNVHPGASFHDLTFDDFQRAAAAVAPVLAQARDSGVGPAVLQAVQATRSVCATNVNLGICLLMAPIAAVADANGLRQGVAAVVEQTTVADAEAVYAAIRHALPGGLGEVADQDVREAPTMTLLEAMQLAEERDAIAYQWSTRFRGIDRDGAGWIRTAWNEVPLHRMSQRVARDGVAYRPWEIAIIAAHLEYMAQGDTLIRRKCGDAVYEESRQRASAVLAAGGWMSEAGWRQIDELDDWLRADGHRRNPGTSADLIAGSLLWALRKGWITPPSRQEILEHAASIRATGR